MVVNGLGYGIYLISSRTVFFFCIIILPALLPVIRFACCSCHNSHFAYAVVACMICSMSSLVRVSASFTVLRSTVSSQWAETLTWLVGMSVAATADLVSVTDIDAARLMMSNCSPAKLLQCLQVEPQTIHSGFLLAKDHNVISQSPLDLCFGDVLV